MTAAHVQTTHDGNHKGSGKLLRYVLFFMHDVLALRTFTMLCTNITHPWTSHYIRNRDCSVYCTDRIHPHLHYLAFL
jgi:hypothetical protein